MAVLTIQLVSLSILIHFGRTMAQTSTSDSTTITLAPTTPPPTHAPFPTATVAPLPVEFSDIPKKAIDCWDSHIYYSITSSFLRDEIFNARIPTSSNFPTPIVETSTYVWPQESCATQYPGLTTLCDGYPRASDCVVDCTITASTTSTHVYTTERTFYDIMPTWTTELDDLAVPTCTVAPDLGPECERLAEAYSWRVSQFDGVNTATQSSVASPLPPDCSVLVTRSPSTQPRCSLVAQSYEAYYWPTPTASKPSAFCSSNATLPTATPTIPGRPNTAVISGLTMTSPYIYQVLHNVTLFSVQGRASAIGLGGGDALYKVSSVLPLLTLSQPSSSILSQSSECHKPSPRGATRCTLSINPDFLIQDLFTINAKNYYGEELATPTIATICQASYRPTVALAFSEVVAQNGIAEDCVWTWEHSLRTSIVGPPDVFTIADFLPGAYRAITASGPSTATPQPGSLKSLSSVAVPTSGG